MTATTDLFGLLLSPEVRTDPYPTYARYLAEEPVALAAPGLSFVFRYEDCMALLRDRRVSVDERNVGFTSPDALPTLIHLDPPDHTRLRRLVGMAFTPKRVEALRTRAVQLVDDVLASWAPGDEVDIVADLAYPVPLTIICDLLGVPVADRPFVRECSTWMARSIDPGPIRSEELNVEIERNEHAFVEYIRTLADERRRHPGDDLLSDLVVAETDGERLSEDELLGLALLLLVAGHETTVSLVGNGVLALLRHREQFALLADGAVDDKRAIDELLRFDSPVQMTSRIALEDIELPTGTIEKHSFAVLMLGAANHDPRMFTAPARLDLRAVRATGHLAFGFGIHHCLGALLARAEAEAAVPALVRRFPRMALADAEPPLRPTFVLRGRESLRVRL